MSEIKNSRLDLDGKVCNQLTPVPERQSARMFDKV